MGWLAQPRDWIANFGEMSKFWGRMFRDVYGLRVFRFFGEALRQAGILILSSTLVIWGLVFIIGLQCGIEGAYFNRAVGAPAYAGVFAAWCDLREIVPYAFGYMMAAKVGTGIVAELGSMRISDEIDALEAGDEHQAPDDQRRGDDEDSRLPQRLAEEAEDAQRVDVAKDLPAELRDLAEAGDPVARDGEPTGHRMTWISGWVASSVWVNT